MLRLRLGSGEDESVRVGTGHWRYGVRARKEWVTSHIQGCTVAPRAIISTIFFTFTIYIEINIYLSKILKFPRPEKLLRYRLNSFFKFKLHSSLKGLSKYWVKYFVAEYLR